MSANKTHRLLFSLLARAPAPSSHGHTKEGKISLFKNRILLPISGKIRHGLARTGLAGEGSKKGRPATPHHCLARTTTRATMMVKIDESSNTHHTPFCFTGTHASVYSAIEMQKFCLFAKRNAIPTPTE